MDRPGNTQLLQPNKKQILTLDPIPNKMARLISHWQIWTWKREKPWYKPGANTVFYFPFKDNTNDVMGNATLSWGTYTKQETWYLCAWNNNNTMNSITMSNDNAYSVLTMVSRVKVTNKWYTSWSAYAQPMCMSNWNVQYNYYSASLWSNCFRVYKANKTYTSVSATLPDNSRHLLVFTTSDTATICYIDKTPTIVASSWWYFNESWWNWFRLWRSWTEVIHSNVIWESRTWTQQDVDDYYELTKSDYWL